MLRRERRTERSAHRLRSPGDESGALRDASCQAEFFLVQQRSLFTITVRPRISSNSWRQIFWFDFGSFGHPVTRAVLLNGRLEPTAVPVGLGCTL
jgi:hypothetical protein